MCTSDLSLHSYWYNYTYYLLTEVPWHIPAEDRMANLYTDSRRPLNGRLAVKIWTIRGPPVSPEVRESDQLGSTLSLDEAFDMFSGAEVLDSPMVSRHTVRTACRCGS